MLISADVRPRNVKRGVSTKKLCQALGFKEEVGLREMCGRLDLSAEVPQEFGLLCALFRAFSPLGKESSEITISFDGIRNVTYRQPGAATRKNADE